MEPKNTKALVCLSGGVDSTAALLKCNNQFSEVRAIYVNTSGKDAPREAYESCRKLGIQLIIADAEDLFRKQIREVTQKLYLQGLTPNPCAICNATVKLAVPYGNLKENELLVTGHYAIYNDGKLLRGKDPKKDQSYFLSLVSKKILDRMYFPLADSMKTDVRAEVIKAQLPFLISESQDLCFSLGKTGKPGKIVNQSGEVTGEHTGLDGYTIGQRKGIGAHDSRKFVVEIDRKNNRLIIGNEEDLYTKQCYLTNINWLVSTESIKFPCLTQIRYRKPATPATIILINKNTAEVVFDTPQKSVAPGQVLAMYQNKSVIGGGIISKEELH